MSRPKLPVILNHRGFAGPTGRVSAFVWGSDGRMGAGGCGAEIGMRTPGALRALYPSWKAGPGAAAWDRRDNVGFAFL